MRIVFHGEIARHYVDGFAALLGPGHEIASLPDALTTDQTRLYRGADVLIANRLDATLQPSAQLRLFQVPSAGNEKVDRTHLPTGAALCNCFGHEGAIAEYVLAALLMHYVPLVAADRALRQGEWPYHTAEGGGRNEFADVTVGLLGYGHIGRAIAARLAPFNVRVEVANRSAVALSPPVTHYWRLVELREFMSRVDAVVVSLPLTAETRGIVNAAMLAAMPSNALLINVGRGPVVDEVALYEVLKARRIAGAIIDTWYRYPGPENEHASPSRFPFAEIDNIVMTGHMSGWTAGTRRRRQETMAENIGRLERGAQLLNRLR